jgi:phosphoglycerate-specific signal transduction histidine kinase
MKQDEVTSIVLGCSVSGFYKWKKQKRPIIELLDKYFTKEELEEFILSKKIAKLERLEELEEIEKKYNKLIKCYKDIENEK